MNEFVGLPARDRAAVFEETAARLGIGRAAIVEKDFWVCWTLAQLFGPDGPADVGQANPSLLFKGGTSLSKVYGLIDRFSEDVDLTVDRSVLIEPGADPDADGIGQNERKRRIEAMADACILHVEQPILTFLQSRGVGTVESAENRDTLEFSYPRSLPAAAYGGEAYVNAAIRLEFGARGDLIPSERGTVTPYAAKVFPELFRTGTTPVHALSPRRTFWEKATILHEIAFRDEATKLGRQSRHYSDLARIAASPIGTAAMDDIAMLREVARHKMRYYPKAAARYDLASPGTLRLVPPNTLRAPLAKDYGRMREMFIADPPPFEHVLGQVAAIERRINESPGT